MKWVVYLLLAFAPGARASDRMQLIRPAEYSGMCDASAAVAVSSNLFIVASDENNTLRVYRNDQPGPPAKEFQLDAFLEVTGKSPEADLEAAARIGDRVFWMSSHGRNINAKERLNRCRFLATDIRLGSAGEVMVVPAGKPYKALLSDLTTDPRLVKFRLDEADELAPKDAEGLNIEGLAATPDGRLLVGFRNPIPAGKALIVPLENPNEMIAGQPARLGALLQLDLDGLGIRDMALWQGSYTIIAGPYRGGGKFKLYRWAGGEAAAERIRVDGLSGYNPEAIIIYPDKGSSEFQVLSDDGERLIEGVPGKQLKDPARKKFRSFWLKTEP